MKKYLSLIGSIISFILVIHFGRKFFGDDLFSSVGSAFIAILFFLVSIFLLFMTFVYSNDEKKSKNKQEIPNKKERIRTVQVDEPATNDVIEIHFPETFVCENNKYFAKYTYENILIVGYKYREPITDLKTGEDLFLELEPENEYDDKAVKVSVLREYGKHHIGYIAMNSALHDMAYDYLIANKRVLAKLSSNDTENLLMHMVFYSFAPLYNDYFKIIEKNKPLTTFTFSVDGIRTGNDTDKVKVGDKVTFYYECDWEKDRDYYNIMIGRFVEKRASSRVREIIENNKTLCAFVEKIDEIDYKHYKYKVAVFDESKLI